MAFDKVLCYFPVFLVCVQVPIGLCCVYMCACRCVWRPEVEWGVLFSCSSPYEEHGFSLSLEFTNLSRLSGWEVVGIHLSLSLQCWGHRHEWLCRDFSVVAGDSSLSPHGCNASTFSSPCFLHSLALGLWELM